MRTERGIAVFTSEGLESICVLGCSAAKRKREGVSELSKELGLEGMS